LPGQGLGLWDLPPDLAEDDLYDLRRVAGGWQPKALLAAMMADARRNAASSPTGAHLAGLTCSVALIRAEQGLFPGTPPLIGVDAHAALLRTPDVRCDVLVARANHDTLIHGRPVRPAGGPRHRSLCQCAVQPQSIVSALPVMLRASSEQR
jgi:lipase